MSVFSSIHYDGLIYDHIIGVGGIGSGMFFSLAHNHTMGRNESRMATLLPVKDYCKQHIIMHYVAVLLGAEINGRFQAFPIGMVGQDPVGEELVHKMKVAGMNTASVRFCSDYPTLFSVCYQYPDGAGGNITAENSASSQLTPVDIAGFFEEFTLSGKEEIILSVPEVPVATRLKLLEFGRVRGSLNVASLLSSEVEEFREKKGFEMVDLLAINMDEAGSIAKMDAGAQPPDLVVEACINSLVTLNPGLSVLITNGGFGSYCFAHNRLEFMPSLHVPVVSTAGAGDAFLAGTIVGLCCGLPLAKEDSDLYFGASPLKSAVELGTLLAALSVTAPDTIHPAANAALLYQFARERYLGFGPGFNKVFEKVSNTPISTYP